MRVTQGTAMEYRRRVSLAMNYISGNLGEDLALEEIAGAASFSMFHFHRIFKAVVGETVAEFTRRLRLESAANRLLASRHGITRIALDCGFSSSQNFAKAFRQHFGTTPSAYRLGKGGNASSKGGNALSLRTPYDADIGSRGSIPREWKSGMRVEVQDMPEREVAFVRKMGAYERETAHATAELMRWAGPRGYLGPDSFFGIIYWDNPEVTPRGKCRVDACIGVPAGTVTEGPIGLQPIGGGPFAVCGFAIGAEAFPQAWEDAFAWLVGSGYECDDRPCYESYHNDGARDPEGRWIFDICIPLISR
jgi:AraC family transcriptional regulator